jgi:Zn-dependent protease
MDIDPIFIRSGLLTYVLLVASFSLHEWAHAMAADLLGDDTPRNDGRLTLNPLVHIDLVGTVILPLFNIFVLGSGFPFIGWAKPVRLNESNFRHRTRDDILVTLAGSAANIASAFVVVVLGSLLVVAYPRLSELVHRFIVLNVGLTVFNLLPVPPLDGGRIFRHVVGMSEETFIRVSRVSGIALLFAINLEVVQQAIGTLVELALLPYWIVGGWINPQAILMIYHS